MTFFCHSKHCSALKITICFVIQMFHFLLQKLLSKLRSVYVCACVCVYVCVCACKKVGESACEREDYTQARPFMIAYAFKNFDYLSVPLFPLRIVYQFFSRPFSLSLALSLSVSISFYLSIYCLFHFPSPPLPFPPSPLSFVVSLSLSLSFPLVLCCVPFFSLLRFQETINLKDRNFVIDIAFMSSCPRSLLFPS